MAKQRNSRADNTRVQETIRLIKSLPTIRRTRVKSPTRTLNPKEYERLLTIIQDGKSFPDKLRFEYTRSTNQFEIRTTTQLHEGLVGVFLENFVLWRAGLGKLDNPRISHAAETLRLHGNAHIEFSVPEGPMDMKSPDGGIRHICELECPDPALVFEVGFTNTREELNKKARDYILRSEGKIRTVIVVYVGDIYAAERKNERRLRKGCRSGEIDESGLASYPKDAKNITAGASILVWRARIQRNNTLTVGRVQEKKFRDTTGSPIRLASLHITLEDCVCDSIVDLAKESEIPSLEIPSESFCNAIDLDLIAYRKRRAKVVKEAMEKEKKEKEEREKHKEEGRQRRATEIGTLEDVGVLGRVIVEHGTSFSARIRGKKS
ncbi:hypothetical protein F4803DRAFT_268920 [Xylaria telfairii]|nr:hypothetical protein F4803DRAFT_268920 [Xylaria telfairii]